MEINIKFDEKMIVEVANRVLDEYEYNGKTIREWADLIANPKTKIDRIRSMTDEELALWLAKFTDCGECPICAYPHCTTSEESCACRWHEWLKGEASE